VEDIIPWIQGERGFPGYGVWEEWIRGNGRRRRRKGRGDDPRQLVEPRPGIVYMRAVLAVWIGGGVYERLTVDT